MTRQLNKSFAPCTIYLSDGSTIERVVHDTNSGDWGQRATGFVTVYGHELPVMQLENYKWETMFSSCALELRDDFNWEAKRIY